MNTKHLATLLIAVSAMAFLSARADEAAPAQPTPAPAQPTPAPAEATGPAPAQPAPAQPAPSPAPAVLPRLPSRGPAWESLPPNEREHVRRMAEIRAVRDKAAKELVDLGRQADARKKKILEENEEAKELNDRIEEIRAEFAAATNALETIYRQDEELGRIAARVEPARRIVENNQEALNKEVAEAMKKRLSEQRAAWEKRNPPPESPEPTPESTGMDPQAFTNLFVRPPRPAAPAGPLPVNPDIKPAAPAGRLPGQPPAAPLKLPSPAAPAAK